MYARRTNIHAFTTPQVLPCPRLLRPPAPGRPVWAAGHAYARGRAAPRGRGVAQIADGAHSGQRLHGRWPVVILARLAISRQDQGRGIGFGLLQDAIRRTMLMAEQAGIWALLTHPIDAEAAAFYTRFGFIASPLREKQLLLPLKDARRWVRGI